MFFSYQKKKLAVIFNPKPYVKIKFTSNTNQIIKKIKKYQKFICQYSLRMQHKYIQQKCKKRTFYTVSGRKEKMACASLTVEAAMVFPIFILAFFLLIYSIKIVELQSKIQYALEMSAMELADYAVAKENSADSNVLEITGNLVYSQAGVKVLFENNLKKCNADQQMLSGKVFPFSFGDSQILRNNQEIYLVVRYKLKVPGFSVFFPDKSISCVQNTCVRAFVGVSEKEWSDNQIVYITTGEQVYHISPKCTHLTLSIEKVSTEEFAGKQYYKKYTSCAFCRTKEDGEAYYITKEGTKYHKSILCKGLKRTVERIPFCQAEGRRLCSRCSKKK